MEKASISTLCLLMRLWEGIQKETDKLCPKDVILDAAV
jgi:hypothetical protein